jgi:hypothetical protein
MPRLSSARNTVTPGQDFVFIQRATSTSPGQLYKWDNNLGWGSRTDITLFSSTSQSYNAMATHPTGNFIFLGLAVASSTFFLQALSINKNATISSVSGALTTKAVDAVDVTPSGKSVIGGFNVTPYVEAYPFTTTFGSKFSDPATTVGAVVRTVKFSPTGASVLMGLATSPLVAGYPWSDSTGFGTKFSNPGTVVTGSPLVAHSLDTYQYTSGTLVVSLATNSSPYINAYQYTDNSGFGTKYTAPSAIIASIHRASKFIFNGVNTYLMVSAGASPFIAAVPFSSSTGYGTVLSNPATIPSTTYGYVLSTDQQVVFAKMSSLVCYAYRFSDSWGTKYADPSTAFTTSSTESSICYVRTR